jgi:hypothetical protein
VVAVEAFGLVAKCAMAALPLTASARVDAERTASVRDVHFIAASLPYVKTWL